MSEEYRVPKKRLPARLALPGRPDRDVVIHLSEMAERREGAERPSDLLDGALAFIPVAEPDGSPWLLARNAVLFLSVPAEAEAASSAELPEAAGGRRESVCVLLEDGRELRGAIGYVMPPGRRRLSDYLNDGDAFVPLRERDVVHLINRRRIVAVHPSQS